MVIETLDDLFTAHGVGRGRPYSADQLHYIFQGMQPKRGEKFLLKAPRAVIEDELQDAASHYLRLHDFYKGKPTNFRRQLKVLKRYQKVLAADDSFEKAQHLLGIMEPIVWGFVIWRLKPSQFMEPPGTQTPNDWFNPKVVAHWLPKKATQTFKAAIDQSIRDLEGYITKNTRRRGPRLRIPEHRFVRDLAQIFKQATGKNPSYASTALSGAPRAPFPRFVSACMRPKPESNIFPANAQLLDTLVRQAVSEFKKE